MLVKTTASLMTESLHLEGVTIGEKKYSLDLTQEGCRGNALSISFKDRDGGVFVIKIDERGIALKREALRPNHDHSDMEEYLVVDGAPAWANYSRTRNYVSLKPAYIAFGPVKVDY